MSEKCVDQGTYDEMDNADDKWGISNRAIVLLDKKHRIAIGDCTDKELMAALFNKRKAQTIITSPPYADMRGYDGKSEFKPRTHEEWLEWWPCVADNLQRVLEDTGNFFLNIRAHVVKGQRTLYVYKAVIDMVESGRWKLLDDMIWKKIGMPGKHNRRLKDAYEPIYHFTRTLDIQWYPKHVAGRGLTFDGQGGGRTRWSKQEKDPLNKLTAKDMREGWVVRTNVLPFSSSEKKYVTGHPATFPITLPMFFMHLTAKKGQVIFDPFLGSGTTVIAAVKYGYRGYGVEISKRYALNVINYLVDTYKMSVKVKNL